jgi:type II secretory pathway pseudopilin PulG
MTLAELLVCLAIIGLLSSTSILLLQHAHVATRYAKAQADVLAISTAVQLSAIHTGSLPPTLLSLASVTKRGDGAVEAPYLASVPEAPPGWSPYAYDAAASGVYTVSTAGDGRTVLTGNMIRQPTAQAKASSSTQDPINGPTQ